MVMDQLQVSSSASTSIPSLFDKEFDEWSKLPGNLEKWEKSVETLGIKLLRRRTLDNDCSLSPA
ncbi:hypothetical protein PsorP6_014797 [Peronosclerospora sorghi]|uniref:Uncharacterized protein n=1 Tax=Peronosclerospora sorghi TaxID=230839 RepID=A0ACC0VS02_9STRA|nr:hypothetical protein PsorP6_014797 [Peronosclerospora sorghi]